KWRRERDSNPRYGFPYSGFQDIPFHSALSRISSLQSDWLHQKWENMALFGTICSPLCSPRTHRVVNSSSGFPSQAALSWTRAAKKPGPGAPIPSRTRDWDAYILINGPGLFAWWTRHQSGNDRFPPKAIIGNQTRLMSKATSRPSKSSSPCGRFRTPESRIVDSSRRKSAGKIDAQHWRSLNRAEVRVVGTVSGFRERSPGSDAPTSFLKTPHFVAIVQSTC